VNELEIEFILATCTEKKGEGIRGTGEAGDWKKEIWRGTSMVTKVNPD